MCVCVCVRMCVCVCCCVGGRGGKVTDITYVKNGILFHPIEARLTTFSLFLTI